MGWVGLGWVRGERGGVGWGGGGERGRKGGTPAAEAPRPLHLKPKLAKVKVARSTRLVDLERPVEVRLGEHRLVHLKVGTPYEVVVVEEGLGRPGTTVAELMTVDGDGGGGGGAARDDDGDRADDDDGSGSGRGWPRASDNSPAFT